MSAVLSDRILGPLSIEADSAAAFVLYIHPRAAGVSPTVTKLPLGLASNMGNDTVMMDIDKS